MGVDVDLSQYCDVILLWNAAAMFFISFSTDYWEYRDYNYWRLVDILDKLNNTQMDGWDKFKWRNIVLVQFSNIANCSGKPTPEVDSLRSKHNLVVYQQYEDMGKLHTCRVWTKIYLFSEYANLYRECNDLQDSTRLDLSAKGLLYSTTCHNFMLTSTQWHHFHIEGPVKTFENMAFASGCLSAILSCIALTFGTVGSVKRNPNCVYAAGLNLGLFALFYFLTTTIFVVKTQILQNSFVSDDANESDVVKAINGNHNVSLGWSFAAAVFSLVLSGAASKVYISKGRKITRRRKSEVRRKRLEAALMSPCQQEVALALRAKMIVVQ